MWPQHCDQWLPSARARALERTFNYLSTFRVLTAAPEVYPQTAQRIAERAVARAEVMARQRHFYAHYLVDARELGRWLAEQAHREALRLLTEEQKVLAWLSALPAPQRRILLWLFADHLTLRELARILPASPNQAREQAIAAYQAFVNLLPPLSDQPPDMLLTFPVPPGLIGAVV